MVEPVNKELDRTTTDDEEREDEKIFPHKLFQHHRRNYYYSQMQLKDRMNAIIQKSNEIIQMLNKIVLSKYVQSTDLKLFKGRVLDFLAKSENMMKLIKLIRKALGRQEPEEGYDDSDQEEMQSIVDNIDLVRRNSLDQSAIEAQLGDIDIGDAEELKETS
jgi:hypothetical protein